MPSKGWIPRLRRGLFELSVAFASCVWITVTGLSKQLGSSIQNPHTQCCSETPQQSWGRGVNYVETVNQGEAGYFIRKRYKQLAVGFLTVVHLLGAVCCWFFFFFKNTIILFVSLTCRHKDTTYCTIIPVCNNAQKQKAHAAFMSCRNNERNESVCIWSAVKL